MPITLQFISLPGTAYSYYNWSPTLAAFQTKRVRLNTDADFAGMPTGWIGSVKVTIGVLAVTSDFFTWSGQTDFSFNAFPKTSPATQWVIPMFLVRNSGLTGIASTPLNVQNASGYTLPPGYITLNCYSKAGSGFSNFSVANDVNVAPDASYSFNPATDITRFPITGWLGYCQVVSGFNLVVLAQMRYPANQNAAAYQAIPTTSTDKKLFFPVIEKRLSDGSATAVNIQNLSTSPTTVYFSYKASCPGFSDITVGPYSLGPLEGIDHNHRLVGLYGHFTSLNAFAVFMKKRSRRMVITIRRLRFNHW